jgi:hypothetical protein
MGHRQRQGVGTNLQKVLYITNQAKNGLVLGNEHGCVEGDEEDAFNSSIKICVFILMINFEFYLYFNSKICQKVVDFYIYAIYH